MLVADVTGAGLNRCCGLDGAGLCVAATETSHEGWLGGGCLDHVVASSHRHFECVIWGCIWV